MLYKLLSLFMAFGLLGAFAGCDRDRKVAEETDVDEGLFGETEIEKKEVIEREDGRYETREETTTVDPEGRVQEREVEVDRPDGTDVDVDGGREGVDVDIQTRD